MEWFPRSRSARPYPPGLGAAGQGPRRDAGRGHGINTRGAAGGRLGLWVRTAFPGLRPPHCRAIGSRVSGRGARPLGEAVSGVRAHQTPGQRWEKPALQGVPDSGSVEGGGTRSQARPMPWSRNPLRPAGSARVAEIRGCNTCDAADGAGERPGVSEGKLLSPSLPLVLNQSHFGRPNTGEVAGDGQGPPSLPHQHPGSLWAF